MIEVVLAIIPLVLVYGTVLLLSYRWWRIAKKFKRNLLKYALLGFLCTLIMTLLLFDFCTFLRFHFLDESVYLQMETQLLIIEVVFILMSQIGLSMLFQNFFIRKLKRKEKVGEIELIGNNDTSI